MKARTSLKHPVSFGLTAAVVKLVEREARRLHVSRSVYLEMLVRSFVGRLELRG